MNEKFASALKRKTVAAPPIWMMRQAGRYHSHYQALKKNYTFQQLCLNPKLAAEVALGPIQDFDFDVAILFSDILFPVMAIGVDLIFEEFGGPKLQSPMTASVLVNTPAPDVAIEKMLFQKEAMRETRKVLPADKSLIGFVGGPWTLFSFATQGTHKNGIREAKLAAPSLWTPFIEIMEPLLERNIRLQIEGGAEVVMILDTAAGDLAFEELDEKVVRPLSRLARKFPGKLGYYAKGLNSEGFALVQSRIPELAGQGVDHRLPFAQMVKKAPGFLQGNFDPEMILLPHADFKRQLRAWWDSLAWKKQSDWDGWVCGLGHGILPGTPEENVRYFVRTVREWAAEVPS